MAIDRPATSSSVVDVLDHVLEKGIVIDAWVRLSVVGIDLVTVEARVVVASIDTYLSYAGTLSRSAPLAPTPASRFNGPGSPFTVPGSRFPVPGSRSPVRGSAPRR